MTDDDSTEDTRDPLRAAFEDYTRAPADIVPKQPWTGSDDDLHDIDNQTVEVTYWCRDTGRPVTERIATRHPVYVRKSE